MQRHILGKKLLKEITPPIDGMAEGSLIEWQSPIFGLLSGRLEMIDRGGIVVISHPLTGELASIPLKWVKRIKEEK